VWRRAAAGAVRAAAAQIPLGAAAADELAHLRAQLEALAPPAEAAAQGCCGGGCD
jgi:hypothetical protein